MNTVDTENGPVRQESKPGVCTVRDLWRKGFICDKLAQKQIYATKIDTTKGCVEVSRMLIIMRHITSTTVVPTHAFIIIICNTKVRCVEIR